MPWVQMRLGWREGGEGGGGDFEEQAEQTVSLNDNVSLLWVRVVELLFTLSASCLPVPQAIRSP